MSGPERIAGVGEGTAPCARDIAWARVERRARRAAKRARRDRLYATALAFCIWGCGSSDPFKGCNNLGCNNSGCNNSGCNNTNSGCNNLGCNNSGCGDSSSTGAGTFVPTSGFGPKPIAPTRPPSAPSGMTADDFEPNETLEDAAILPEESDAMTDSAYFLTLHTGTDVDFFKFHVEDQGIDGNPEVTIALDSPGPEGERPAISVTYSCDSGVALDGSGKNLVEITCDDSGDTCGVDSTGYAITFTTECKGNDDSVTVFLEIVSSNGQPKDYSLQFFAD